MKTYCYVPLDTTFVRSNNNACISFPRLLRKQCKGRYKGEQNLKKEKKRLRVENPNTYRFSHYINCRQKQISFACTNLKV